MMTMMILGDDQKESKDKKSKNDKDTKKDDKSDSDNEKGNDKSDKDQNQPNDNTNDFTSSEPNKKNDKDPDASNNAQTDKNNSAGGDRVAETGANGGRAASRGAGATGSEAATQGATQGATQAGIIGSEAGTGAAGASAAGAGAGASAASAGATTGATTGAAAGGAAVGGAAAAGSIVGGVGCIILLIIIIIGIVSFFVTMPQFLWNQLKELGASLWDGLEGYVIGIDESTVNKDDIIGVAQYLYDMGYDLVGMGFADEVEIYGQLDEDGNEIPVEEGHEKNEIKSIESTYLRSYLVAENRTYLINDFTFNLKDFALSIFNLSFFEEGTTAWSSGLINLDEGLIKSIINVPLKLVYPIADLGPIIEGVKVDRENNLLRIRRWNFEILLWETHRDYTYYDLTGWSGRYGKPFELMLTLHVATMAPDLVQQIALNDKLDGKVNIKLKDTTFSGHVYVGGKTIDELEAEVTYQTDAETGEQIAIPVYSAETISELRKLEDNAEQIKTSVPYISSVTNHWFRNVYFEGADSMDSSGNDLIGVDEENEITGEKEPDGIEDYTGELEEDTGYRIQKTEKLSTVESSYEFESTSETFTYEGEIEGIDEEITFQGTFKKSPVQVRDAVRGVTNETTKKLFSKEYYIYDGTVETAKRIQADRRKLFGKDPDLKGKINLTEDSLSAFTILEESESLDSQFIYRDLKELTIELNYFDREDFNVIEKQVLEWPIPDYTPLEWPDRKLEKQILEYGTLISSEATIANSLGISVERLRELKAQDDEEDESNDGDIESLEGTLFIGDSYIVGLQGNVSIDGAEYRGVTNTTPQYWLDRVTELPTDVKQVCVYLGVNDPTQIQPMQGLIESLSQRYSNKKVYVIEVMHLSQNYYANDVDEVNSLIDTFNGQVRTKCESTNNVFFIDASQGLVSGGYLQTTDSEGIHIQGEQYQKWAQNIATQIERTSGAQSSGGISGTDIGGEVTFNNNSGDGYPLEVEYNGKTYKHYLQWQGSWASKRFPNREGCTISGNGCGIVAAAIILSAYPETEDITPPEVADETMDVMETTGHYWPMADDIAQAMTQLGVEAEAFENEGVQATANNIQNALNQGKEVIVRLQKGSDGRYTQGLHYVVLIKSVEGEGITIINPSNERERGNTYEGTLEEFVADYMPNKGAKNGYLITNENLSIAYNGFEPDEDVIAMGNGKIVEILDEGNNLFSEENIRDALVPDEPNDGTTENDNNSNEEENEDEIDPENPSVGLVQDGVKIKLTDNALKGYTLVIYGIKLNENLEVGQEVRATDVIGKTREDSDICLILIDRDKAVIEDIEEYIKVPSLKGENKRELPGDTPQEKVWIALKEAGYSDTAAAAALGNIEWESGGFNPGAIEGGSGEGFGLCQWSFDRKTQLFEFAERRGVDPSDVDLQIEFLLAELTGESTDDLDPGQFAYQFADREDKRNTWENSSSIEEATIAFCQGFERPRREDEHNEERIEAAKRYYEEFAGAT